MAITFSHLTPDERAAKARSLIGACRKQVPRLSSRLPLPIGTTRLLWQNLFLLVQIFSDNYNADRDDTFGASPECEEYIECFRAWIGLLAACDLPLPERQTTDEMRAICGELMLQRLIFMVEHIKARELTPKAETPLSDLESFKHGLLRNLWPGIRRQEKLMSMDPALKPGIIADIKALEYELATLQYDTPEFADWENRYQNVLERADRSRSALAEAGEQPGIRSETESVTGSTGAPARQSPWQVRTRLLPAVRFENVRAPEVKTAGMAVLAYRAGLMKGDTDGKVVRNILEHKILGISRFSPER